MATDKDFIECKDWALFNSDPVTVTPRWLLALLAVLFGIGLAMLSWRVGAEPLAETKNGGAVITIHTEACAFQAAVDMPNRATWQENGKTFEGCVAYSRPFETFVFYFPEDRSVFPVPKAAFRVLVNA